MNGKGKSNGGAILAGGRLKIDVIGGRVGPNLQKMEGRNGNK